MKPLLLAVLSTLSFTVQAETLNLTPFKTKELTADGISAGKKNDDVLNIIKADYAWARGYTGKGSIILIADTGINASHTEFKNSIGFTKDFSNSKFGIIDRVGHGTGLAGIAAANWDGIGMAGVAPDATLAIAKVTDNTSYNFSTARAAMAWGNSIGATVTNISANYVYDSTYTSNMAKLKDGTFMSNDARYRTGYYLGEKATTWAPYMGTEMVLVNSAGNQGVAYPANPGILATATDSKGNLILGGRVIIVGSWDVTTNNISTFSNRAGTICQAVVSGTCTDKYRVSDFYIMAPGNEFAPTATGTDTYAIQTGTSQAAAVVSGSVAVIRQMWPLMTGANIVKLLGATADKSFKSYNVNIHGQGLLNLDRATQPVGALGIPTTGAKTALTGAFVTNTSGGLSAVATKLSSLMVTDDYDRDYYVDIAKAANAKRARADFDPISKAGFYSNYNPYQKLNYYTNNGSFQTGEYDIKLSMNEYSAQAMMEVGKTTQLNDFSTVRVGFGMLNEQRAWMGNSISGAFGQVDGSYTAFTNVSGKTNLNKNVSVFGSVWLGNTTANLAQTGLVTQVSDTQSYSWNMGVNYTQNAHSFGATVSQPMTVLSGTVDVALPTGYTATGDVAYTKATVSITPTVNEYDFGAYYKYNTATTNLVVYGEQQVNYLNQAGVFNTQVGIAVGALF